MAVGGNVNPLRQAMINMMYLVLLALLALNVSRQVLEAFENLNKGIEKTTDIIEEKTDETMKSFAERLKRDSRAQPYYELAEKVQSYARDLDTYIVALKKQMIEETGQPYEEGEEAYLETGKLISKDDIDVATRIMIEKKEGDKLQAKINETREKMLDLIRKNANMFPGVNIDDIAKRIVLRADNPTKEETGGKKMDWKTFTFHHVPLAGAVAILSKIQSDVKATEAELTSFMFSQIGATAFEVKDFIPIVKARKTSVPVGEKFHAEIFLSAQMATKTPPKIKVGEHELEVGANGIGVFEEVPNAPGTKQYPIIIELVNPKTGEKKTYQDTLEYDVFKAPAIISADAMKVLYIGLDNPISVSVPGYKPSEVSASISNGSLVGRNGKYIAKVKRGRKSVISAYVRTSDGKQKFVGREEFKVKPVPKPTAYLGSKASGEISRGELKTVRFVLARMGQGFAFEGIKFRVTKYKLIYQPRRGPAQFFNVQGPSVPPQAQSLFRNAKRGDMIIVTNIYARSKGIGEVRLDNGVTLTVK